MGEGEEGGHKTRSYMCPFCVRLRLSLSPGVYPCGKLLVSPSVPRTAGHWDLSQ